MNEAPDEQIRQTQCNPQIARKESLRNVVVFFKPGENAMGELIVGYSATR
jgi:hypothetical protein